MGTTEDIKAQMARHAFLSAYGTTEGPQVVNLSLVSFDRAGCAPCQAVYCPIHRTGGTEPWRCHHMPLELVDRVLAELAGFERIPVLRLLPQGELSAYRWLPELADRLRACDGQFPIAANTNGLHLDTLSPLLPYFTALEVSINATTETCYRQLRPGARQGDLNRLVEATRCVATRVRRGDLRLRLIVSFVGIDGINTHEWPAFRELWESEGAEPVFRPMHSFSGFVHAPANRPGSQLPSCKSLFTRLSLASDGSFARCYNDILGRDIIGRLQAGTTLQSLWYSPENLAGMLIMLGEIPGRIFCSDCVDRVCADPRTGVGLGSPFEEHVRRHHRENLQKRRT